MKIVYIGPAGATFTSLAYEVLARCFGAPVVNDPEAELCLVEKNEEVVSVVADCGGYGAIAMETKAQGRVDPPMNSFIELLEKYNGDCPVVILGAIKMKLHFALMTRPDTSVEQIDAIIAHPKAIGACRARIKDLGVKIIESSSNGKAAEEVANNYKLRRAAALGPIGAAQKYGLQIVSEAFEDEEAITTFFLLGPRILGPRSKFDYTEGKINRSLFVFRAKHIPGALVKVLTPFADEGINLIHIHSLYTSNGSYDFAIEAECRHDEVAGFRRAVVKAQENVKRNILFGPFPILAV